MQIFLFEYFRPLPHIFITVQPAEMAQAELLLSLYKSNDSHLILLLFNHKNFSGSIYSFLFHSGKNIIETDIRPADLIVCGAIIYGHRILFHQASACKHNIAKESIYLILFFRLQDWLRRLHQHLRRIFQIQQEGAQTVPVVLICRMVDLHPAPVCLKRNCSASDPAVIPSFLGSA